MMIESIEESRVNVLASGDGWGWPCALRDIFAPKGISLLIARGISEFISVIGQKRIHTLILDADQDRSAGLATVKIIRKDYPRLPCILLSSNPDKQMLTEALQLDVFSVINKPVDIDVLHRQMDKLFIKRYGSRIFS
jgi:DNA-binding NtrC family response regulator